MSPVSVHVPFGTLCLNGFERSSPSGSPAILAAAQPGVCNPGPTTTSVKGNPGALGITVGEDVKVQVWDRDPGAVGNANVSGGILFAVR